ncbi:peptidyl-tRNA hydrolase Pth2 [Archaeoglobus veneficus]|uniref:Peptidyl-tRNA hydrolase n=1 Tax=Archaeoglobus veneficus (strain DSM 11195 / SNP6) TaxID=693661 RepID=F2KQR8_ARCVS|nr:peptidyl-tRNA hydrolase Pth2 [Archaeoglobus veneficus]AEA46630.1 Peptidyl-tRNA hydrolase [Archaeoglobus veneficus SNP6]
MGYKQVIVVRDDLNLSRGKLAVQVAHAAILGYELADRRAVEEWKREGQKKIVLRVENIQKLMEIKEKAAKSGLPTAVVRDAGLTEVPPGTVTAVVIGPDEERRIDKITGNLPLLK